MPLHSLRMVLFRMDESTERLFMIAPQLINMLTNSAYAQETGGDLGPTSRPADTVVTSGLLSAAATEKVSEIGLCSAIYNKAHCCTCCGTPIHAFRSIRGESYLRARTKPS
jgi:hypothetical protein